MKANRGMADEPMVSADAARAGAKNAPAADGATLGLAQFIVDCRFEDMPQAAVDRAKDSFLDTLGITLAGATEEGARLITRYVRDAHPGTSASLIGQGARASAGGAALANGTMAHIVGFSDFSVRNVLHPSVAVLPAVWALAEELGATGRDVIAAHVVGVETACKIGAVLTSEFTNRGFHPCAIVGAFGATAAAGRLLGLSAGRMGNALGIAGVQASGIKASLGTMSKAYAVGRAAENGVVAAKLAAAGFTGSMSVLEGRDGFFQTFGAGVSGEALVSALGNPFEFVSPGITIKPYPACTRSHPAIDAALEIATRGRPTAGQIASIDCEVAPAVLQVVKIADPRNAMEAKFSLPFCLAAALLDGKVVMETFTDERLDAVQVRQLMQKVHPRAEPALAQQGAFAARVTVRLHDGSAICASRGRNLWEEPGIAGGEKRRQLLAKFESCAARVLNPAQIAETISIVDALERQTDVARLMDVARAGGAVH